MESCISNGAIRVEKVGDIEFIATLLSTDRGEDERIDMAYLLERGLFMAINQPFTENRRCQDLFSSYPNAQQILNRKLLPWGEDFTVSFGLLLI